MRPVMKCAIPLAALLMASACGQPEHPRTVSDFCLAGKRISAEPAPTAGADDPGNRYDTDETFGQVLEHNAAYDRLCPGSAAR